MTSRRSGRASESGYVAAELALGVGLLVFPIALLVLTLPTWSERQTTARSIRGGVAGRRRGGRLRSWARR